MCNSECILSSTISKCDVLLQACIIVLLCFTSRRKHYCQNILWGIPSVIVWVKVPHPTLVISCWCQGLPSKWILECTIKQCHISYLLSPYIRHASFHPLFSCLWMILLFLCSPVNLLGGRGNGYRLVYCVVLSCWGADLLHNILDRSLYYSSQYSLLDAVYFFSENNSTLLYILHYLLTQHPTSLVIYM